MRILFCKIAHMKCYKGADNDPPRNGGSSKMKGEVYNFDPEFIDNKRVCLGYVQHGGNQMHIENIKGCEKLKTAKKIDDVLVVWCATADTNECVVVGWYKHATVYRRHHTHTFEEYNYTQYYNVKADYENCVLLPDNGTRRRWEAPTSKKKSYGFGESLVWYASEEKAENYIKSLVKRINDYSGENWIDKYPNEVEVIKI